MENFQIPIPEEKVGMSHKISSIIRGNDGEYSSEKLIKSSGFSK